MEIFGNLKKFWSQDMAIDLGTANTDFFPLLSTTATTEGSFKTTPLPFNTTSVFAVPRSIAIS